MHNRCISCDKIFQKNFLVIYTQIGNITEMKRNNNRNSASRPFQLPEITAGDIDAKNDQLRQLQKCADERYGEDQRSIFIFPKVIGFLKAKQRVDWVGLDEVYSGFACISTFQKAGCSYDVKVAVIEVPSQGYVGRTGKFGHPNPSKDDPWHLVADKRFKKAT